MLPRSTSAIAIIIRGRPAQARARQQAKPQTRHIEIAYSARIREQINAFREHAEKQIFGILEYVTKPQAPKFDDPADIVERTFAGLRVVFAQFFDKKKLERITTDAAFQIEANNKQRFRKLVKTVLKVDPLMNEPWLMDKVKVFVKENVSLITTIPREQLAKVEQMIYRDAQRNLSPQEMKQRIIQQFNLSDARADLIATDQVLKFNGSLTEARQQSIGVKRYYWRTAGDQRVRGNPGGLYPDANPSHWHLEGKMYSWSKPPISGTKGERLHPGQPIRCRCYAEPVLEDLKK